MSAAAVGWGGARLLGGAELGGAGLLGRRTLLVTAQHPGRAELRTPADPDPGPILPCRPAFCVPLPTDALPPSPLLLPPPPAAAPTSRQSLCAAGCASATWAPS